MIFVLFGGILAAGLIHTLLDATIDFNRREAAMSWEADFVPPEWEWEYLDKHPRGD